MNNVTMRRGFRVITIIFLISIISNAYYSSSQDDSQDQFINEKINDLKDLIPHPIISITSDDDFISQGFPGNGSITEPYRIENLNITFSEAGIGIYITNTTKHCVIQNNYLDTFEDSIYVNNVAPFTIVIQDNIILFSSSYGVKLKNSEGVAVSQNIIAYNYLACIYLYNCSYSVIIHNYSIGHILILGSVLISVGSSDFVEIYNNTCVSSQGDGILLYFSKNAFVVNNTCIDSHQNGIWLKQVCDNSLIANNTVSGSSRGLDVWESSHLEIVNNTCVENKWGINIFRIDNSIVKLNKLERNSKNGLSLGTGAYHNEVFYNKIKKNILHGVHASEKSDNNLIYLNNFINNNVGGKSQGFDDGTRNIWYLEGLKEGNYWSDLEKRGPYDIDGISDSQDRYPLKELIDLKNPTESKGFIFIVVILSLAFSSIAIVSRKKFLIKEK